MEKIKLVVSYFFFILVIFRYKRLGGQFLNCIIVVKYKTFLMFFINRVYYMQFMNLYICIVYFGQLLIRFIFVLVRKID